MPPLGAGVQYEPFPASTVFRRFGSDITYVVPGEGFEPPTFGLQNRGAVPR